MPMNVFERIVENLDLMDRFSIRKVSKHLRAFTDSLSPGFKLVTIRIYESATTVCYDQNAVAYSNRPRQFFDKIDICFVEIGDERVEIKNATHDQLAAQDLKIVLGNPKLELEELEIERCCFWHSERLVEMIKSIPSPIHVERLTTIVNNPLKELEIIGCLRPRVLNTIHLDMENHSERLEKTEMKLRFDALIATPQCQQVEMMTVVTYLKMEEFPMDSFLLAPRFTLNFEYLSVKDVMHVFRNLSKFAALDHFILKSDQKLNLESIRKQLNQRFSDIPDRPYCMHYWDRKSPFSFEIRFSEFEIRVAKQQI
ncbi:hypothetical protein CAEBREN_25548 [Caenorhabditis brenneri]|uniref:F-box domain-containing protein n=1 Tax=Caenorhabditis brenneri TaxID=135651 RepID=G0MLE4_CAEBE|nr:hypothetical protein CAEBREN_25548 [Caenorhabditis brenneri]